MSRANRPPGLVSTIPACRQRQDLPQLSQTPRKAVDFAVIVGNSGMYHNARVQRQDTAVGCKLPPGIIIGHHITGQVLIKIISYLAHGLSIS